MAKAMVITAAGINCDVELVRAFELAGAEVATRHLNELLNEPALLDEAELIGLPGGFSFGDAVAAGRIMASLMRERLYPSFVRAVERGVPMIAPCNGFQIAVQMGLLPGPRSGEPWPERAPRPSVALAVNESGRFVDRWVGMEIPAETVCVWTKGLDLPEGSALLPIAHGEGRFVAGGDGAVMDELERSGRIAVRYAAGENPNGSMGDVAGVCDGSGLIFGLMPHPERYTRWTNHPWWTGLDEAMRREHEPPGLQMFRNAVAYVEDRKGAAVQPLA